MRRGRRWVRSVGAAAILGVLLWRVDLATAAEALSRVDAWSLAAASAVAAVTTVCGAWRWVLVAHGLGVPLTLRSAVTACYRSQFLNVALPGGVLGDVHRGVRHGRAVANVGGGLRSVLWERAVGQGVQVLVAVPVLVMLPSGLGAVLPLLGLAILLGALAAVAVARHRARASSVLGRSFHVAVLDVRQGLLGRRTWPGAVVASAVALAGHVVVFLIAARIAGISAPTPRLIPLAMLVLLAMAVPFSLAGWGPREGAAAWAFGAAGLGVDQGLAVAIVHGVLVLAAALPGAAILLVARRSERAEAHA